MKFDMIWTIIKKEFLSLLRNKKVLIGALAPILLMPILFYGYQEISTITQEGSEATVSEIYVEGQLPEPIQNELDGDQRIVITEEKSDADLILEYSLIQEAHNFVIKYDYGRNAGNIASERVLPALEIFQEQQQKQLLTSKGLSFESIYPAKLSIEDLASESEVAGYTMSNILPILITLFALLSVLNFAVELTTAEKEMGTLETIFSVPIKKVELIVAKLLACIAFGVVSMALNLGVLLYLIPKIIDVSIMGFSISLSTFLALFLNIIPLIFIGAGLSIAVGLFANSYKEANAYLTPLVFVFMIPAYIGSTPGLELNVIYSLIPIVNTTLLMKTVFMSQLNIGLFTLTILVNALFAVVCLSFMFKVFGAEKILFGNTKGLSFTLKRGTIDKKTFIGVEDVFMSLAIIVVLYIYGSVILPNHIGMFKNLLFVQYMFFALLPILIIWYFRASLTKSLGLRIPTVWGGIAGVFIWLSALSLALIYQIAISPYIVEVPTLVDLESQLENLSTFTKFFLIALTPGICEEILFRGFALRPLEKKIGAKWAVIITALAFSIVHLDFVRLVPTFLLGLAFGYVAVKTKSLYPSIFLHVLNNSIALFMPATIILSYKMLIPLFVISLGIGLTIFNKID